MTLTSSVFQIMSSKSIPPFLKSVSELTKKLRSEPTPLEIAEAMACSLNQIDGFFNLPIKPMRFNRRTVLETEARRNAYHYGIDAEDEFQDEFQIWDATHEVELTQSRFLAELDEFTDFSHYRAEIASLLAPHEREDSGRPLRLERCQAKTST